jgi:16S rRNA A1518/A1519 N6-dimethyltransferase RsmA/KsgA/DIM1 with predicted DNA glycosylase/AP lyase activity
MNSLSNSIEKEKLAEILKELNISEQARGENLTLEQFAQIANRI